MSNVIMMFVGNEENKDVNGLESNHNEEEGNSFTTEGTNDLNQQTVQNCEDDQEEKCIPQDLSMITINETNGKVVSMEQNIETHQQVIPVYICKPLNIRSPQNEKSTKTEPETNDLREEFAKIDQTVNILKLPTDFRVQRRRKQRLMSFICKSDGFLKIDGEIINLSDFTGQKYKFSSQNEKSTDNFPSPSNKSKKSKPIPQIEIKIESEDEKYDTKERETEKINEVKNEFDEKLLDGKGITLRRSSRWSSKSK